MRTRSIKNYYHQVTSSIGFIPSIMSVVFLTLGFIMLSLDSSSTGAYVQEWMYWAIIKELSSATAILTTLISGTISLMILSFSMVMIVLNQVNIALSPKLLFGIVSEKSHQYILGAYIGSVIYFIVIILGSKSDRWLPGLSILVAIILGIFCLSLFVIFIHMISKGIQVNNIILKIFETTRESLLTATGINAETTEHSLPSLKYEYPSLTTGYLQKIDYNTLCKIAEELDLFIEMETYETAYVAEGLPIFKLNIKAADLSEEDKSKIEKTFLFYSGKKISDNFSYGFTQLMEVAIKAMSPSINDPGTATYCINYLNELFLILYEYKPKMFYYDSKNKLRIIIKSLQFNDLLNRCLIPIARYGGKDITVVRSLLFFIYRLAKKDDNNRRYQNQLNEHAKGIISRIKPELFNDIEKNSINSIINRMVQHLDDYFKLEIII